MSWSRVSLLLSLLLLAACAKPGPGPDVRKPATRPAPTRKAEPEVNLLRAFLDDLQVDVKTGVFPLRKIALRHLPAAQARAMAAQAAVETLEVEDDGGELIGAFVEARPSPAKRCDNQADAATRVYWLATQKGAGGKQVLAAAAVKTNIFRGKTPEPKVKLPEDAFRVSVFKVKVSLDDETLCQQARFKWSSLDFEEVFTVVGGRLRRIVSVNTSEVPQTAGATIQNDGEARWIEGQAKTLYLAVVATNKMSVPVSAAPRPGDSGGVKHSCSRTVTVYRIAATGAAKKLSAAALARLRKTAFGRAALPTDKTSTAEDGCDGD